MAKGMTSTKGTTVLVDRLWPRGISKEDLRADEWLVHVPCEYSGMWRLRM